jgi:hypothetical protein
LGDDSSRWLSAHTIGSIANYLVDVVMVDEKLNLVLGDFGFATFKNV